MINNTVPCFPAFSRDTHFGCLRFGIFLLELAHLLRRQTLFEATADFPALAQGDAVADLDADPAEARQGIGRPHAEQPLPR